MKGHLDAIRPAVDVRLVVVLIEQSPCAGELQDTEPLRMSAS